MHTVMMKGIVLPRARNRGAAKFGFETFSQNIQRHPRFTFFDMLSRISGGTILFFKHEGSEEFFDR